MHNFAIKGHGRLVEFEHEQDEDITTRKWVNLRCLLSDGTWFEELHSLHVRRTFYKKIYVQEVDQGVYLQYVIVGMFTLQDKRFGDWQGDKYCLIQWVDPETRLTKDSYWFMGIEDTTPCRIVHSVIPASGDAREVSRTMIKDFGWKDKPDLLKHLNMLRDHKLARYTFMQVRVGENYNRFTYVELRYTGDPVYLGYKTFELLQQAFEELTGGYARIERGSIVLGKRVV